MVGVIFLLLFLAGLAGAIAAPIFSYFKSQTTDARGRTTEGQVKLLTSLPGVGVALASLLLFLSFTQVSAGTMGIVTKFGQVNRVLTPGAHFVNPISESVHPFTTQTLVVKPSEDAASHDLQVVHTEVTLAYHFDPQYVGYVYSQLSDSTPNSVENKVIIPAILEAIKARTAQYDAQQLISERPLVRDGIEDFVKARLAPYHIVAETVSITDFHFSKDYEQAIEAKVTAQQSAEKANNDLTRIKVEAEQKVAAAEGEARALAAQKQQITPELLQLRTIEMLKEKWDGKLPDVIVGGNSALPMMDVLKAAQAAKK